MIAKIAKIKQHRADRQARQVRMVEAELEELRNRQRALAKTLNEFIQWQLRQTEEWFQTLSEQPASLVQIDEYNSKVAGLKIRRNDLTLQLTQVEEEEAAGRERLREAIDQLRIAERTREKFDSLAKETRLELIRENAQQEEKQAEEIAADRYQNSHKPQPAFGSLAGA